MAERMARVARVQELLTTDSDPIPLTTGTCHITFNIPGWIRRGIGV